jgi:hypothetical protein
MLPELFGDKVASEQALPVSVGAQAATPPAVLSDSAQEPFHRVDLSGLDANEVAPARQSGAQITDRWARHVN